MRTRILIAGAVATLFAGVIATAVGSSYYHLAPDNARLVWDRMPMTLDFMGLLTALITERVDRRVGRWLLVPLIARSASPAAQRPDAAERRLRGNPAAPRTLCR